MKSLTIFTVLMLLFAGFALANIEINTYTASKDFIMTSATERLDICSCGQGTDIVTVKNLGTFSAIFSVNIDNPDIRLSEKTFELAPQESKDILLYYQAGCSEKKSSYTITVISNLGLTKYLQKGINVQRCQNVEFRMTGQDQNINPCQNASYTLFVQNVGTFAENYILSSNFDSNMKYSATTFSLQPNQIAQINATVQFSCSVYGTKDIIFNAQSVKNGLFASLDAKLNIAKNYDYDISINNQANDTTISMCNRLYYQIPVTITNKGVANTFTIDYSGMPGYADAQRTTFDLDYSQSKTVYIHVNAQKLRSEYKNDNIKVLVSEKLGDIEKTKTVSISTKPCYEESIKIFAAHAQKNPEPLCAENLYNYDAQVVNNGIFTENFTVWLDAPSYVDIQPKTFTLEPGATKKLQVYVTAPDQSALFDIKAMVSIDNGITSYDYAWFNNYDKQSCHAIITKKSSFNINFEDKSITVPVQRTGILPTTFRTMLNGNVSSIASLDNQPFYINKSENIVIHLNTVNKTEKIYEGFLTFTDLDSGAQYKEAVSINLKDKSGIRKTFEFFAFGNICRQFSLYEIFAIILVCILIIIFLIVGPNYQYKFSNRVRLKIPILITLIVIFFIGLALVIIFVGFPKTYNEVYNLTTNATALKYEWLQNDHYDLNVANYFYSPENTTLTYKVSDIANIKTSIKGSIITFYPDYGWSGVRRATITATDPQGASTVSPKITLSVVAQPRKNSTEIYDLYCWYVNLAILIILLIVIFLAVIVKQKRRTRK